jgi:hypothetical protein
MDPGWGPVVAATRDTGSTPRGPAIDVPNFGGGRCQTYRLHPLVDLPTWHVKCQSGFTTLLSVLLQEQLVVLLLLERALAAWSLAVDEYGRHKDLHSSGRRSVILYVHGITELYCSSLPCLSLSFLSAPVKWRLSEPFIAQGRAVIMSPEV